MTKEIKNLHIKKNANVNPDEVSPDELSNIAGGANPEDEEGECIIDCGTFKIGLDQRLD